MRDKNIKMNNNTKTFIHTNREIYVDLSLSELSLSAESYNALSRNGFSHLSEIIDLSIENLYSLKNIRKKYVEEISDLLDNIILTPSTISDNKSKTLALFNEEFLILVDFLNLNPNEFYEYSASELDEYLTKNDGHINNTEFKNILIKNSYIQNKYEIYLINLLSENRYGCTEEFIYNDMHDLIKSESFISNTLCNLIKNSKIVKEEIYFKDFVEIYFMMVFMI